MGNAEIATEFLRMCARGDVREAYERHVAASFVHHNAWFPGDRESLLRSMEESAASEPNKSFEPKQVVDGGDRVAVLDQQPAQRVLAIRVRQVVVLRPAVTVHADDDRRVVAVDQVVDAAGPRRDRRPAREQRGTVPASEPEQDLVADERGDRGDHHHAERMQVAALRGQSGQHQDRLAFQQAAQGEHPVPVRLDERTEIHQRHFIRPRSNTLPAACSIS